MNFYKEICYIYRKLFQTSLKSRPKVKTDFKAKQFESSDSNK